MNTKTDKQITIDEVITTFRKAIDECQAAELRQYVVAFVSDATPMRISKDGTIRIVGDRIYSTAFSADGKQVVDGLNAQFSKTKSETRVALEKSDAWRARRADALRGFIATIQNHAADTATAAEIRNART